MAKRSLQERYLEKTTEMEDAPVLNFLKSFDMGKKYQYLEVGAGMGRFPLLAQEKFANLDITALEINPELASILNKKRLKTIPGSVLDMPFENAAFDIVHCSHLIEHFGYPEIIEVLDELFRVTKVGGFVIIRTPLMHENFYNDIDHIRPYPLKSLRQYFNNEQQQTSPKFKAKLISYKNRYEGLQLRGFYRLNKILKYAWLKLEIFKGKANGYIVIFKKV